MEKIKIERGISVADATRNRKRSSRKKTAFAEAILLMAVGDSFVTSKKRQKHISDYARRCGVKLKSISVDVENIRVWRIS